MIQNPNGSGRRILTLPAVHPYEAISPATLLTSLIDLAHNICSYKSKFFFSNKRNGHEAIRQVGILLIFLEEIRDVNSDLPDSVILSLSELHLIFQKLQYLLEDSSREAARLWMLIKSEVVANRFRVLIRSIATAIDVFPFDSINLPVELKEHVDLVTRQARKTRFEVECDDEDTLHSVNLILSKFVDGVVPCRSEIKRVLDYLGIKTWSSCNKEMKFLDSEVDLEWLSKGKKEVELLSSLMGFMSYCRCVLFDEVDSEAFRQTGAVHDRIVLSCLSSDDFRCPISLEFMNDPVTLITGHTYDRSSILRWFRSGNLICPKTGEKLENNELVSNMVLRRIIQQYCSENGIPFAESGSRKRDITRTVSAGSLAAEQAVKMVANFLAAQLEGGKTEKEKNRAAYEIRLLTKSSILNRACFVEAGVIPLLLNLLRYSDSRTQENSMAALLNLSKHSKSKVEIVENGGIDQIVHMLKNGVKPEAQQHAAGTLFYIASIDEYRKKIGENPEAIPALVDHIKTGSDRSKKNAMVAMFGLLMHPANHRRVLSSGTIPLLVNLLRSDREDLVTDSLAILSSMGEKPDGTFAIMRCSALELIIGLLDSSVSKQGKEYCVSLLHALCINGGVDVVHLLAKNSSLMASLYSLLSEGTSRAGKKASALIRILQEYCENRSSGSTIPTLPRERFIHVW